MQVPANFPASARASAVFQPGDYPGRDAPGSDSQGQDGQACGACGIRMGTRAGGKFVTIQLSSRGGSLSRELEETWRAPPSAAASGSARRAAPAHGRPRRYYLEHSLPAEPVNLAVVCLKENFCTIRKDPVDCSGLLLYKAFHNATGNHQISCKSSVNPTNHLVCIPK